MIVSLYFMLSVEKGRTLTQYQKTSSSPSHVHGQSDTSVTSVVSQSPCPVHVLVSTFLVAVKSSSPATNSNRHSTS